MKLGVSFNIPQTNALCHRFIEWKPRENYIEKLQGIIIQQDRGTCSPRKLPPQGNKHSREPRINPL